MIKDMVKFSPGSLNCVLSKAQLLTGNFICAESIWQILAWVGKFAAKVPFASCFVAVRLTSSLGADFDASFQPVKPPG